MRIGSGRLYHAATAALGTVAAIGVASALYSERTLFTAADVVLTLGATTAITLVALNAISIRGLRTRRSGIAAEAVFLDVPIAAPLLSFDGAVGSTMAAIAFALGFLCAALIRRGAIGAELLRHGIARTLISIGFVLFAAPLSGAMPGSDRDLGPFAVVLLLVVVAYTFLISAPVAALRNRMPLRRIWHRTATDHRFWGIMLGGVAWSIVVRHVLLRGDSGTAIALWFPVVIVATFIRALERARIEIHRLRLVRDAVQAMLGARDPVPQIKAIINTLHRPLVDETVSVLSANNARVEHWRTVATLGAELGPTGDDLRIRVLARMKFSGRDHISLRDDVYVVHGFAARQPDTGELLGALVVHRRESIPASQQQHFLQAAHELQPLLRDMRTITATQSAASTDALTGLANRRTILDFLHASIDGLGPGRTASVLLLDLDHFKSVNDELGHQAGDDCLRTVASTITSTIRARDRAGRIGGEEFLVVMPDTGSDQATVLAERLRQNVEASGFRYATGLPLTTSIGVSSALAGDSVEGVLERADRAMYSAKERGRNRVVEISA